MRTCGAHSRRSRVPEGSAKAGCGSDSPALLGEHQRHGNRHRSSTHVLTEAGFEFAHPTLRAALQEVTAD
ncbi:MAG: DUF1731 domain-containing protein [Geodermatophilaceae bacterium]|nr:DUF1731 domain-containing protein [Geodermatophilaceae bacterium]